jgi:hypothetical protein
MKSRLAVAIGPLKFDGPSFWGQYESGYNPALSM